MITVRINGHTYRVKEGRIQKDGLGFFALKSTMIQQGESRKLMDALWTLWEVTQ